MPEEAHTEHPRGRRTARRAVPLLVGGLATALGLSACTGGGTSPAAATSTPAIASGASGASGLQQSYENVIHAVLPSVVEITTGNALGSGIVGR